MDKRSQWGNSYYTVVWQISARSAQFPNLYLYPCLRTDGGKPLADLNLAQPTLFTDGVSMSTEIRAMGCNRLRATACWFSLCAGKSGLTWAYAQSHADTSTKGWQQLQPIGIFTSKITDVGAPHRGGSSFYCLLITNTSRCPLLQRCRLRMCEISAKTKANGGEGLPTVIQETF